MRFLKLLAFLPALLAVPAPGASIVTSGATAIQFNQPVGKVNIPAEYLMSFTLQPTGIQPTIASIFHFTKTGENCCAPGTRMPGVWFVEGTTKLMINVATSNSGSDFATVTTSALPLGQVSNVNINFMMASATEMRLVVWVNGVLQANQLFSNSVYKFVYGDSVGYLGDPWHAPAKALIGDLKIYDGAGDKSSIGYNSKTSPF